MLLNDLEISCEQLYLLSSSKQLQLPNPFLPLWNQLKSVLGPAGKRSSSPWAWCTTALTITPPCQLLNSHTLFILPNRFFHSVTDAKELAGEPGIDPRSAPPPLHRRDFSILSNAFLSLLSQLTLRLLFKGAESILAPLAFEHHSLHHYNTMAKADRLYFFYST